WGFLNSVSGELLANEDEKGLTTFKNGQWQTKIKKDQFPKGILLRTALPIGQDSILLVSLANGLFIIHRDSLSSFTTPDIKDIASKNIVAACLLSSNSIALMTNLGGCNIINK